MSYRFLTDCGEFHERDIKNVFHGLLWVADLINPRELIIIDNSGSYFNAMWKAYLNNNGSSDTTAENDA